MGDKQLSNMLRLTQRPGPDEKLAVNKARTQYYHGQSLLKTQDPHAGLEDSIY